MTQVRDRTATTPRTTYGDELASTARTEPRGGTILRMLGAIALLAMGVIHLEQYFAVHYRVVPTIGPLFALNFVGAAVIAAGLILPTGKNRVLGPLLALGGIAMAATSIVFLVVSEQRPLFGFAEYGYRPTVVLALAVEAAAIVLLAGYLASARRRT
jgi:hypothetical protein